MPFKIRIRRFRWRPRAARPKRIPSHRYADGEVFFLWGKTLTLRVLDGQKKNAVCTDGDVLLLSLRGQGSPAQREKLVRELYRSLFKEKVEELLPKRAAATGLSPSGWQTKYMTSRWGTCNTRTHKIWLSPYLAQQPPECLDYVILHELAHLAVADHGPRFRAILDAHMPGWRQIRRQLNRVKIDDLRS